MKKLHLLALVALCAAGPFPAAAAAPQANGQVLATIVPKDASLQRSDSPSAGISPAMLTLKIDGKQAAIAGVEHAQGPQSPLELVFLLDESMHASFASMLPELTAFSKELPAHARMAIAYMANGRAVVAAPLTSDPARIEQSLHIPAGLPGGSGSPYFCLSDLAKNWPSQDGNARREVILITDGIDHYNPRFDPDNPYVESAIRDSARAGLTVFSIYWTDVGRADHIQSLASSGQDYLQMVTQATGGYSYWQGYGNPVSIDAYLQDVRTRLRNQYRIRFTTPPRKKAEVASMQLRFKGKDAKLAAPSRVLVAAEAGN